MAFRVAFQVIGFGPGSQVRSLGRGIGLAALVGVVAGIGAVAFSVVSLLVVQFALEALAGYEQAGPAYQTELPLMDEGEAALVQGLVPWMLVVLPTLGGLVSGILVAKLAPEARGPGTDAAIRAYHHRRGLIEPRVPLVKLVASSITLGTGGSGGREGPIAQIGAGLGSYVATKLGLSDSERRILMAAGLGAGVGAIFHAPLAGAIFAIEVLYRDPDFEAEALIPAFIATAIAYSTFSLAFGLGGFHPLFSVGIDLEQAQPLHLIPPLAVLAVVMSLASLLFVRVLYGVEDAFGRLPLPMWSKPAIGGLLTGVVALVIFYGMAGMGDAAQHNSLSVLSYGYGFLQQVLTGNLPTGLGAALTLLLVVGLGKIVTTSMTVGSGGSAGVFGPSMVVGASLGAVVGLLFHAFMPGMVSSSDVVIFAILGMASFFAAAANTPVSTLIMVSEITNSYALLLPSMWVCALAYLTSRGWTLYREQVRNRLESPAHRGDFIIDILKGMTIREVVGPQHRKFVTVTLGMPLTELSRLITSTMQTSFPVLDDEGRYYGLFSLNDIRQYLYESELGPLATAQDLAGTDVEPLTMEMDLSDAIGRFASGRFDELPVVGDFGDRTVEAMLRRQDVITVYDKRLLEMRTA